MKISSSKSEAMVLDLAIITDASWTPSLGGVPGTSPWEEVQGTAQDIYMITGNVPVTMQLKAGAVIMQWCCADKSAGATTLARLSVPPAMRGPWSGKREMLVHCQELWKGKFLSGMSIHNQRRCRMWMTSLSMSQTDQVQE
ncbi:hypothetical protein AMECASPLE_018553 [Ameca splendens]|uniref:Uncharacterized protein n=1 Tax=Ameca splendens TaxID=208324 RepID=A0ABV0YED9_9TELE